MIRIYKKNIKIAMSGYSYKNGENNMQVDKCINRIKIFDTSYVKETEGGVNNWLAEMEEKYGSENFEILNIDFERGLSVTVMIQYKIYE